MQILDDIDPRMPVLIAGPTASGKSTLALEIARTQGGMIVNADALQVYARWRILTARPGPQEESLAPHRLFGHVDGSTPYSVGHWIREVGALLDDGPRPIIVGGTGLYFSALTQGLAEIPPIPKEVRVAADHLRETFGPSAFLPDIDDETRQRIDPHNPMRVQRAWEVQKTTGRGLASWHERTSKPLLPLSGCQALLLEADKTWLNRRIAQRLETMLDAGALEEVRANLDDWSPTDPSCRAIGAPEFVAHLRGDISLEAAFEKATIATRQYAKRQRSWFRAKMRDWRRIGADEL